MANVIYVRVKGVSLQSAPATPAEGDSYYTPATQDVSTDWENLGDRIVTYEPGAMGTGGGEDDWRTRVPQDGDEVFNIGSGEKSKWIYREGALHRVYPLCSVCMNKTSTQTLTGSMADVTGYASGTPSCDGFTADTTNGTITADRAMESVEFEAVMQIKFTSGTSVADGAMTLLKNGSVVGPTSPRGGVNNAGTLSREIMVEKWIVDTVAAGDVFKLQVQEISGTGVVDLTGTNNVFVAKELASGAG